MNRGINPFDLLFNPWLNFYLRWLHFLSENEDAMRQFIRHPADIPISYSIGESSEHSDHLKDISSGGLCFVSDFDLTAGTEITIEIDLGPETFGARGKVAWCRPEQGAYSVGVAFKDGATQFGVRMVEQVCHIEQYRRSVLESEGRSISTEDAAKEWVDKYAADFPSLNSL